MEAQFWHERWHENNIHFHRESPNPRLLEHFPIIAANAEATVFVPLCGKSVDLTWLEQRGHQVIGVELSEVAVEAYFKERGLEPARRSLGELIAYEAGRILIYCGDLFALTAESLQSVDFVYDRAALIALPPSMRVDYVDHLSSVLPGAAATLLIALEYDQREMAGPPFSVLESEVRTHFENRCAVNVLESEPVLDDHPRFAEKGMTALVEKVFSLGPARADE